MAVGETKGKGNGAASPMEDMQSVAKQYSENYNELVVAGRQIALETAKLGFMWSGMVVNMATLVAFQVAQETLKAAYPRQQK